MGMLINPMNKMIIRDNKPFVTEDEIYNGRRDRLADIVAEYLTCSSTSASQLIDDLTMEIDAWISYHNSMVEKAYKIRNLLIGLEEKETVPEPPTIHPMFP